MNKNRFAEIVVDNRSSKTDRVYTYLIPEEWRASIKKGMRVLVPFGFGNKHLEGIIVNFKDECDFNINKVKKIRKILDKDPLLSSNLIELGMWMKNEYLAYYIDVFRTMIPTGLSVKSKQYINLNKNINDQVLSTIKSEYQRQIIQFLMTHGTSEISIIKEALQLKNIHSSLKALEKKALIIIEEQIDTGINKKYEKVVCFKSGEKEIDDIIETLNPRAFKQIEVMKILHKNERMPLKDVMNATQSSFSTIKTLGQKGYLLLVDEEVKRHAINNTYAKTENLNFTMEQKVCFDTIYKDIIYNRMQKFLIHGITGSGKTEIYLQLIEKMLQLNKQTIVLVPEIALTPQTVERFAGRFGDRVAVLHSRLSLGERYDEWRKIKEGSVDIVVGARSAVFAPFNNLGLIVIDEEHEGSYKSNMSPKYHTIDVAEKRCDIEGATLVLGSATPAIESFYRAEQGRYKKLSLKQRVNNKALPRVQVVDMKEELASGNKTILSHELYEAIKQNLQKQKQTILFLNRRGYSSFISCRKCGYVAKCKACDISLTYHSTKNQLKCHYCGLVLRPTSMCPECGSKYFKHFGIGTQKVEAFIKKVFPKARLARMDVDTTSRKGSHERILEEVKSGSIDILIGTQMISKGLDFPNVTLVGIIAADISLNLPDFRSSERTFQLITQVSGRAGRGVAEGKVILQTYEPDHYVLQLAKEHDYLSFYDNEISLRKIFRYPPFTHLINVIISSNNLKRLTEVSSTTGDTLKKDIIHQSPYFDMSNLMGPMPAPLSRIKGQFRMQILIKCENDDLNLIKNAVDKTIKEAKDKYKDKYLKFSIDINPNSIM